MLPFMLSPSDDIWHWEDFAPRPFIQPVSRVHRIVPKQKCNVKESPGKQSLIGKDGFQMCLDVVHFKPNEISVKTVGNQVIIEGKHQERQDDHGFISRQFSRRYVLPEGYDPNTITSNLSSDGVLTVKAPKPKSGAGSNERIIPIQHIGPAALNVKENKAEDLNMSVEETEPDQEIDETVDPKPKRQKVE